MRMAVWILLFAATGAQACPAIDQSDRPRYTHPVGGQIISGFGTRRNPIHNTTAFHTGVDYAAAPGDPVQAAAAGEVLFAAEDRDYGKYVTLRHAAGFETTYAQLSEIAVQAGDCVGTGDVIGRTGATASGPHLHFELRRDGRFLDPLRFIERRSSR